MTEINDKNRGGSADRKARNREMLRGQFPGAGCSLTCLVKRYTFYLCDFSIKL
jgi:hypothetical protein